MSDLNANFKKLKKVVTSEPIETKEVTNFFVDRKIKELNFNLLTCKEINEKLNRNFSFKCTSAIHTRSYRQKTSSFLNVTSLRNHGSPKAGVSCLIHQVRSTF